MKKPDIDASVMLGPNLTLDAYEGLSGKNREDAKHHIFLNDFACRRPVKARMTACQARI